MLTPKRLVAALRDSPPKTTASTTRLRRSSESAIPAASSPRRESMNQNSTDSGIPVDSVRSDTAIARAERAKVAEELPPIAASLLSLARGSSPQESPHFEDGLISALFGPHIERMGSPKAPHLSWRDLSLDDCETRTRTSGLVIRDSPHQNANLQLHFGPRKNEGMAEALPSKLTRRHACRLRRHETAAEPMRAMREAFINQTIEVNETIRACRLSRRRFGLKLVSACNKLGISGRGLR